MLRIFKLLGAVVFSFGVFLLLNSCGTDSPTTTEEISSTTQEEIAYYTVSFDTNGANELDDITNVQGGTSIELPVPEKEDFLFVEWQLNGESFTEDDTIINDITLSAVWEDMYEVFETQSTDGVLTITGYTGNSQHVIIPNMIDGNTVNYINEKAFKNSSIKSIKIPNSVIEIGDEAFYNASQLEEVKFYGDFIGTVNIEMDYSDYDIIINRNGDTCQKIEDPDDPLSWKLYEGCPIKEARLVPYGYSVIVDLALYDLNPVIYYNAFEGTAIKTLELSSRFRSYEFLYELDSLESLTIDEDNSFVFEDGLLLNYNKTHLYWYLSSEINGHLHIPASIVEIKPIVFNDSDLESITVHEDNQSYSSEDGVLYNKDKTDLIVYPSNKADRHFTVPFGVKRIATRSFSNAKMLENVEIPNSVIEIGEEAFYYASQLETISFYGELIGTKRLELMGRDYNEIIETNNCVEIDRPIPTWDGSSWELSEGCPIKEVTNTSSFAIGYDVYYSFEVIVNLALFETNSPSILDNAFEGTSIKTLNLPSRFRPYRLLQEFETLENITIDEDNPFLRVEDGVLYNKDKTKIYLYLPSRLDSHYQIPKSVEEIAPKAFNNEFELESITVHEDNPYFTSEDGVLFNKDETELIVYPSNKTDSHYKIPIGVNKISKNAFSHVLLLESVEIPNTVILIEQHALSYAKQLETVSFYGDFNGDVEYIYQPNDYQIVIDEYSEVCVKSSDPEFPDDETRWVFSEGCPIKKVYRTRAYDYEVVIDLEYHESFSMPSISFGVFEGTMIKNLNLSKRFRQYYILRDLDTLETITIHEDNLYYTIEDNVLFNRDKTELILFLPSKKDNHYQIPASVTKIWDAYTWTPEIITVHEDNQYFTVEDNVLFNKDKTKLLLLLSNKTDSHYQVPASVTQIASIAFCKTSTLESITVHKDNHFYSAEDGVLFNKDKTKLIYYPSGKTNRKYAIPEGVKEIHDYAFINSTELEVIVFPSSVTLIEEIMLSKAKSLKEIVILDRQKEINFNFNFPSPNLDILIYLENDKVEYYLNYKNDLGDYIDRIRPIKYN